MSLVIKNYRLEIEKTDLGYGLYIYKTCAPSGVCLYNNPFPVDIELRDYAAKNITIERAYDTCADEGVRLVCTADVVTKAGSVIRFRDVYSVLDDTAFPGPKASVILTLWLRAFGISKMILFRRTVFSRTPISTTTGTVKQGILCRSL